jgi:formylglycine-generating enzyme required for sulfatase activity
MSQPRIFVSYSRKDQDITQRLASDLHKAGAEVWVDVDGIQSGNFMQAIDQALMKCDWMVLVLSPSALESNYVSQETYTALHRVQQGYMRAVIPILVAQCSPGSIPPQWDVLQRYDATQDYDSARDGVLKALGLAPLRTIPPAWSVEDLGSLRQEATIEQANLLIRQIAEQQSQDPTSTAIMPDRFPQRLADLGFTAHSNKGIQYILPPLCLVPAGPFLMGSDPKRDPVAAKESWTDREKPQHTVTLPACEIARFPVTVAEYACFVRADLDRLVEFHVPNDWHSQLGKLDHPMVNVSWPDAVAYVAWISGRTRERWRLATEAEWEKAARGTDGRIYPWGDTFDTARSNTSESGIRATTPVGSYPSGASPYGVQDMAGNVFEWTGSRYLAYPYIGTGEREDPDSTDKRVLRGGSWTGGAWYARAAYRFNLSANSFVGNASGFRLVRAFPNS